MGGWGDGQGVSLENYGNIHAYFVKCYKEFALLYPFLQINHFCQRLFEQDTPVDGSV